MFSENLRLDARSVTSFAGNDSEIPNPTESLVAKVAIESFIHVIENFSQDFRIDNGTVLWEKRDADFMKLLPLKAIIDLDLSDGEFNLKITEVENILQTTWIFQKLNSREIEVSKAHTGTTPFEHTLHVLQGLKTTGLTKKMVRAVRWVTIWHDLGKIFGASKIASRFHSQLSVNIAWEFFYTYCEDLDVELIQQMLFAIQFHHSAEGYDFKWLAPTEAEVEVEAQNRLQKWHSVVLLYVMSSADILSVTEYEKYVTNLNSLIEHFQPIFFHAIRSLGLFRSEFGDPNTKGNEPNGQHAQPTKSFTQP